MLWLTPLAVGTARAQPVSYRVDAIELTDLRAPPTAPAALSGAVYFSIINHGAKADQLLSLTTPVAVKAEMHRTVSMDGVMRMREITAMDLPPGVTVEVEPGALHVMLQGLKQPLKVNSEFPLSLQFRDAGMLVVQVRVKVME